MITGEVDSLTTAERLLVAGSRVDWAPVVKPSSTFALFQASLLQSKYYTLVLLIIKNLYIQYSME